MSICIKYILVHIVCLRTQGFWSNLFLNIFLYTLLKLFFLSYILSSDCQAFQFCLIVIVTFSLTSWSSQHVFFLQPIFLISEKTIHHSILVFLNLPFSSTINFLLKETLCFPSCLELLSGLFQTVSFISTWFIKIR